MKAALSLSYISFSPRNTTFPRPPVLPRPAFSRPGGTNVRAGGRAGKPAAGAPRGGEGLAGAGAGRLPAGSANRRGAASVNTSLVGSARPDKIFYFTLQTTYSHVRHGWGGPRVDPAWPRQRGAMGGRPGDFERGKATGAQPLTPGTPASRGGIGFHGPFLAQRSTKVSRGKWAGAGGSQAKDLYRLLKRMKAIDVIGRRSSLRGAPRCGGGNGGPAMHAGPFACTRLPQRISGGRGRTVGRGAPPQKGGRKVAGSTAGGPKVCWRVESTGQRMG